MMKIKICEIFESLQGEGKYIGIPMLFIRVSGCTRKCDFCDTPYHINGKEIDIEKLIEKIRKMKLCYTCWTGGEPLLYRNIIRKIVKRTPMSYHHLETNGDKLLKEDFWTFHYLSISPKELKIAERIQKLCLEFNPDLWDIKIVTDLKKIGKDMIKLSTTLMPLTIYNQKKDLEIYKKVWEYCVKNNKKFTPRLQTIFGKKRRI